VDRKAVTCHLQGRSLERFLALAKRDEQIRQRPLDRFRPRQLQRGMKAREMRTHIGRIPQQATRMLSNRNANLPDRSL
jgi:hypothetical protein